MSRKNKKKNLKVEIREKKTEIPNPPKNQNATSSRPRKKLNSSNNQYDPFKQTQLFEGTNEELSKELKRNLERDKKKFIKLLEKSSPALDYDEVFDVFNERSKINSKKLIDLATQALSFVNAVYYANKALSESLGAEESGFNLAEINVELRKILRIKLIRLICREFNLPRDLAKKVIYNVIEKEYVKPIRQGMILNGPQQAVSAGNTRREPGRPKTSEKGSATRYGDR